MNSKFRLKVNDAAFDILRQIELKCRENNNITDEDILTIHSIFGSVFERCTEILEKPNAVTFYVLDEGVRTIAEVKGNAGNTYKLLPEINFCPCPAFQMQVLKFKSELTCKHVLTAWLAKVMNNFVEQKISPKQYLSLVSSIYLLDVDINEESELFQ